MPVLVGPCMHDVFSDRGISPPRLVDETVEGQRVIFAPEFVLKQTLQEVDKAGIESDAENEELDARFRRRMASDLPPRLLIFLLSTRHASIVAAVSRTSAKSIYLKR